MKKFSSKIIVILIIVLLIFSVVGTTIYFVLNKKDNENTEDKNPSQSEKSAFGVWWWNDKLEAEKYLSFAAENDITEIYYCDSSLNSETFDFINIANQKDMKVYLLAGEKEWLNDKTNLDSLIERYIDFQNQNNSPFSGIHLDIEPHQFSDFSEKREEYILKLLKLADYLKRTYNTVSFDYDIPFWLSDEVLFNSETKPAYKHIIDIANRVFVMSYRDSAEKIYDVGKEEIEHAESINKPMFLCVETFSTEGDNVSFFEEGKDYMSQELIELRKMLKAGYGISIHHIKTWYDLKK